MSEERDEKVSALDAKIKKLEKKVKHLRDIYHIAIDRKFTEKAIRQLNEEIRQLQMQRNSIMGINKPINPQ